MTHLSEPAGLPEPLRDLGRTVVMGVLNVTPDSFSDGGRFLTEEAAVAQGLALHAAGADIVDVGGESTRPGAQRTTPDQERGRVLPVVTALVARGVQVSIDTMRASVASAALERGAVVVNDVPGKHKDLYQSHKVACAATRINNQPALRISPHVYNTPEELDRLTSLVAA